MNLSYSAKNLDDQPLSYFQYLFSTLNPPELESLAGIHQGMFTGPRWLRTIAGPGLSLFGLGGWWGKEIQSLEQGTNIVKRRAAYIRILPFQVAQIQSLVDGKQGVTLHYTDGAWFPWTYVYDEIRRINHTRMLGMTITNLPGFRRVALPFLLYLQEHDDGL